MKNLMLKILVIMILLATLLSMSENNSVSVAKAQSEQFLYAPFLFPLDNPSYYIEKMTSVFDHSSPNYTKSDGQIIMFNTGVFDDECRSFNYKKEFVPNCAGPIQSFTDTLNEFPRIYYNGHD